ncbi:MAG: DUF1549 domain-containing protein [Verrucomicrobiales bacterium]
MIKFTRSLALLSIAIPATLGAAPGTGAASTRVDALIEAGYDRHKVQPNPVTDDATFVRRVHLDIIGRIPTLSETRDFLGSKDPGKRARLIDRLLDSPGYTSHQFNFWADILRITSRMNGQGIENGVAYINWVKQAISRNMPYDRFVHELVTARGIIDENGAVGFYLRDRGMGLDHLATTVQTFLGTQMVCAQCHDHPFDEWTQMDYYKLAAFSTPMTVVRNPGSVDEAMAMVTRKAGDEQRRARKNSKDKQAQKNAGKIAQKKVADLKRGLNELTYNFRNSVIGETGRSLRLPDDYQYDDAKAKQVILPGTPFGDKVELQKGESPVEAYADWMTSPTNPRFTKTIANRMWKRVLGVGLFEPVDKINESTKPSNPELLAYLEELMVDLGFNLKEYYRVLYNTRTYQREAQSFNMFSGEEFHYPGPRLRRMSAEQVWDSLVTMIRPDADTAKGRDSSKYAVSEVRLKAWRELEEKSPEELLKRQAQLRKFTTGSEKKMEDFRSRVEQTIKGKDGAKALKLAGELMKYNVDATLEYARLTFWDTIPGNYFRTPFRRVPNLLFRELKTAFPGEDFPNEQGFNAWMTKNAGYRIAGKSEKEKAKEEQQKLREQMTKQEYAEYLRESKALAGLRNYVRASEITSPAPDGHFLRIFGQSDRTLIENANDKASVPQALSMMNGSTFNALSNPYSVLFRDIRTADDSDEMIDRIYLGMLSRRPTDEERAVMRDEVAQAGKNAGKGLVWTLLNTQQFLFVQ